MSANLARFQDSVARALFALERSAEPDVAALMNQPGFAVYRNTVMKGCVDALQANYPAVARLVGEDWFRAAAATYARTHVPQDPRLLAYGDGFPSFLTGFEPAAELPYLAGVAQLDRFWIECHAGRDEAVLAAAALAECTPDALGRIVLHPHACARWAWFPAAPVYTIWRRNRQERDDDATLDWRAEGALLVRPGDAVEWAPLCRGGCLFLDACNAGRPLVEAATAALEAQEDLDLAHLLAQLLNAGAFGKMRRTDDESFAKEPS